jgi:hypothetical protein
MTGWARTLLHVALAGFVMFVFRRVGSEGLNLYRATLAPAEQARVLVSDVPAQYLVPRADTTLYQNGTAVGRLNTDAVVYPQGPADAQTPVLIYAWVWRDSLVVTEGGVVAFRQDENIRAAIDTALIGRFMPHATATLVFEYPTRRWALLRISGSVDTASISTPGRGTFASSGRPTNVTDSGGLPSESELMFGTYSELSVPALLILAMFVTSAVKTLRRVFRRSEK